MTSVEEPTFEVAALPADAAEEQRPRTARGAGGRAGGSPQTSAASAPPAADGRLASLSPPDLSDGRLAMPRSAPSLLPNRDGGLPGVGPLLAQQPPRPDGSSVRESPREASREPPEAPPVDPAALLAPLQAMLPALTALLASLGQPHGGAPAPGATNGVDRNVGRAVGDPSVGDASVPGGTSDFGAAAGEQAGGYGAVPLTPEGVLGFLQKLLDDFGDGATPNDVATKALGALVGGIRGDGATLVSHRNAAERAANTDEALNNLQRQLREAIAKFGEIHANNRQEIEDLIQKAAAHLRIANRLPNEADRKSRVDQILQVALQDAERIIGKEQSNTANTTNNIIELARQMTDQYVADRGRVPDSSTLDSLMSAVRAQESEGSGGYGARNEDSGALGAYQIMPQNLNGVWANWDREALGRDVSIAEFRNSPAIQDAIASHKLGEYYAKYGRDGALSMWYSGDASLVNSTRPQDGGYPSIARYVREVGERM